MKLWQPKYSNCIIWAVVMQYLNGGFVCWRKSYFGWWPHGVWSPNGKTFYEYVPLNFSGRLKWWQVIWLIMFKGEPRLVTRERL